jgi:oxygen-independent coproporphyrinogen-3 oxidase
MAPLGLYLHIPFCQARCGYCDFVTYAGKDDQRDAYVAVLCEEIRLYGTSEQRAASSEQELQNYQDVCLPRLPLAACLPDRQAGRLLISTVFLGGGTPSVLEPEHIHAIFRSIRKHFAVDPAAEVTLEANPESISVEKLKAWHKAGINRLSIGLQAYDDDLLRAMGRLHTVEQFERSYQQARQAGFDNISVDLIYGLPGQGPDSLKQTLEATVALSPEHISLYSLTVEEHTPFAAQGISVDADAQAEMYDTARGYFNSEGYEQYEISNFARPGRACRHNLIYWRAQDYLGLGVGAVGCVAGTRWQNHKDLRSYLQDALAGKFPRASVERLDEPTRKFERLMLGLRLREGIAWEAEEDLQWASHRAHLAEQGYLEEIRPGTWRIPDPYVSVTNQILLPFVA